MYRFSQRLAWTAGVALPLLETVRRWGTWWDMPAAYLDDWVIGLFLLVGAWMSREVAVGARWLAAGWGCACGIGFLSIIFGVSSIDKTDPAGISGGTVLVVKLAMVSLGLVALVGALGGPEDRYTVGKSK
jgi:hypothetical protein